MPRSMVMSGMSSGAKRCGCINSWLNRRTTLGTKRRMVAGVRRKRTKAWNLWLTAHQHDTHTRTHTHTFTHTHRVKTRKHTNHNPMSRHIGRCVNTLSHRTEARGGEGTRPFGTRPFGTHRAHRRRDVHGRVVQGRVGGVHPGRGTVCFDWTATAWRDGDVVVQQEIHHPASPFQAGLSQHLGFIAPLATQGCDMEPEAPRRCGSAVVISAVCKEAVPDAPPNIQPSHPTHTRRRQNHSGTPRPNKQAKQTAERTNKTQPHHTKTCNCFGRHVGVPRTTAHRRAQ